MAIGWPSYHSMLATGEREQIEQKLSMDTEVYALV
jgi:hypothetical protein